MSFDAKEIALVIGLGRSGLACVEVLRSRGATVFATDEKPVSELADAITEIESHGARFVPAAEIEPVLPNVTSAVLSPGVPPTARVVVAVQDANVPVFGEIEVAFRLCPAPIVAVTGTKGKSTTTSLIGHLLASAGRTVHVGGNIGNPLIREVVKAKAEDWVVAEVSSFQLETIRSFKPKVSVILNISADHLDRYFSMDEYSEAKFRIFANQSAADSFVGNLDDARVAALHCENGETRVHAKQYWFTMNRNRDRAAMYVHDGNIVFAPISGDPRSRTIMAVDEIPLAGRHNVQNTMAALLAAIASGVTPEQLSDAVRSFKPMSHRLEPVAEIDDVLYVDDSKATNPGAVTAALHAYERPIVLIAGGKSKKTDFTDLGRAIDERAKSVVLIGEAAQELSATFSRVPKIFASSMTEAIQRARELAAPGDVVLLSPACASFDMFRSAEDRGEQFAAGVLAYRETVDAK
ncbi:MAG: UDP-N-acetylmuramoyl-L-alanine--D-glutamate ligase [Candidatus Eremiobacteraeota bacterium]|nr:UDP-N-acetylmuramoyl-L-alanine--D-glutamate ligase [Candidatus Eremiobacteraeota bacterium]